MKNFTTTILLIVILGALFPGNLLAYVVGSGSYRLGADSVNFGGTELGASASYSLSDTIGEVGTGKSDSASYSMNAGYRQMQSVYISMNITQNGFSSSVNGLFGGESNASTSVNVITASPSGYILYVKASTSPALKGSAGAFFSDYVPAGGNPDLAYSLPTTESRFGYSPEGSDIVQRFKDTGLVCGSGGLDTADSCWDGFTTSNTMIAQGAGSNHPAGATTTVKVRAGIGTNKIQDSGSYSSTIIYTAVTL